MGKLPDFVTYFDPQPAAGDRPARLPSPFAPGPPHPLARRAAEQLQSRLRAGDPRPPGHFEGQHRGKMFAVLVVADGQDRVGYLRGFSGMIDGSWTVPGFVGPLFDGPARDSFWPEGEAQLLAFDQRLRQLAEGAEASAARTRLVQLQASHASAVSAMTTRHAASRERRQGRRSEIARTLPREQHPPALHELAQQSRADAAELRRLRAAQHHEMAGPAADVSALDQEERELKRRRVARSRELLDRLFDGYQIASARGERRSLRALFAPETPPGGAGDCAAPRLFGHAFAAGLRPLALAEFWWGTPPVTGGRLPGVYYPSCRGKCGPVLGHMLNGLPVEPTPVFGGGRIPADQPSTVFEDEWLVVVDKPIGLLSVPGRDRRLRDSILTRLRARYPQASGPMVVHRLDLDTSGLLLVAKDPRTHTALQRQFLERAVDKRYVAWLEAELPGESGTVDLALRVDLDDRPRQVHDPIHGKPAVTDWKVISRTAGRTRVALYPRTGRTHQLRVHAAHAAGLGSPIVGDRLYGRPGERLMLHAETLGFTHPHTGQRLQFFRPAPF